jgi:hypothetical protein
VRAGKEVKTEQVKGSRRESLEGEVRGVRGKDGASEGVKEKAWTGR